MAKRKKAGWALPKGPQELGRLVAEDDQKLHLYYVGRERYLDRALLIDDPIIFFMGGKGVGKSAILQMVRLEKKDHPKTIINISPDDLAFSAFANVQMESPLLTDALQGQWLFKSLWDYVLLMEIWERETKGAQNRWEKFRSLFMQGQDEKRIQRLFRITINDEGQPISLTDRILELVKEVEVSAQNGTGHISGKVKIEPDRSAKFQLLSEINHAVKSLPKILKHEYYVLIDDLDLHWHNEPNQNAFIAAMFLSLRKLSCRPIKFLVSIREDIYGSLPLADKDKARDRVCLVDWDLARIKEMVEKRIAAAIGCRTDEVWLHAFPENGFEMFAKYSTRKPRELIRIAGLCISRANSNGHRRVLEGDVREAIRVYSVEQRENLVSNVVYVYPGLDIVLNMFRGKEKEFAFSFLDNVATDLAVQACDRSGPPWSWAGQFDQRGEDFAELLADIGFLQVKENRTALPRDYVRQEIGRIRPDMWFAVHPMYAVGLDLLGG